MNFLTSAILSGVAWDIIKSWGYIKSEHLKHKLQDWIIDEKYYETIAEIINEFPDEYKKSVKFLEAAIDEDSDLQNILKLAKVSTVSIQNNSGSEFNNSTIVNNNSGVINNNFTQKKAEIKIIDIEINEDDEYPILDIKVRNIGDEVAFLKKINFNIHDYYEMVNPIEINYQRIESSYTYDVLLSGVENKKYSISQSIEPNGVDRFKIKIASELGEDPLMPVIYKFNFSIFYNEDDSRIESSSLILPVPITFEVLGSFSHGFVKENAIKNYEKIKRFVQDDSLKSNSLIEIYESYEENKEAFLV
ncbi:hypothetical protein LSPH24S_01664 [Lysinibacillus sphaericus]